MEESYNYEAVTVFQSFKLEWSSSTEEIISQEASLPEGVSKQQCFRPTAQNELCTHKNTLPCSSINLATSQAAAQILRTARTEIN